MSKTLKIYIGVLVLLFGLAIVFEMTRPRPIDWSPTFHEEDKIPFGLKVFRDQLPKLFPNDSITDVRTTPYEFFERYYSYEDSVYDISGSYLFINDYTNIDPVSTESLLDFAGQGNTVFISAESFPVELMDTLHFKTKYNYDFKGDGTFYLSNQRFENDSVRAEKGRKDIYFKELDSLNTTVLGYQNFDEEHINFVKIKFQGGGFLLHLQPYLFTNYFLLKDNNHQYATDVLSYIPNGAIYFDAKTKYGSEQTRSPLRFIFARQSLKWAWLLSLLFIITFMLFNAKRRQRVIRIIKPLRNTTVEFTKTVANLYYETKDHTNIIDKKITYFFEKIRKDYHLDTAQLNDIFIKQLALKSGSDREKVKKLIDFIIYLKSKATHTEQNLTDLNKMIEEFYTKK